MEKNNLIEIEKAVQAVNSIWADHFKIISENVGVLNDMAKAYKQALPSDLMNSIKQYTDAVNKQTEAEQKRAQLQPEINKGMQAQAQAIHELSSAYKGTIGTLNQNINQNQKLRAELKRVQTELKLQSKGVTDVYGNLRKLNPEVAKLLQEEAKLKNAISQSNQTINTQTKEILAAEGSMEQMSQQLQLMTRLYQGLSAAERESPFGTQLQSGIKQLDGELKKLDSGIGKYQRNVGNYAKQWDGLRHETNQLIRELPAMAYGANIFFGAISNNLPMFIDQVKKARLEQKAMLAEGKEAPSVIGRITSALFNWQTAIVLGITYLTMHGREVWSWVRSLWGASDAIDELTKAELSYNKARQNSILNTEKDISFMQQQVDIAKNEKLSLAVRLEAVKKLRQAYDHHSESMSDNMFLQGETLEFEKAVTKSIEARNKSLQYQRTLDNNKERVIQLQQELKLREEYEQMQKQASIDRNRYEAGSKQNLIEFGNISKELRNQLREELKEYERLEEREKLRISQRKELDDDLINSKDKLKIQEEIISLISDNAGIQVLINKLEEEGSKLDIKQEKAGRERSLRLKNEIDYLASVYELRKRNAEVLADENRIIMENPEMNFDKRLEAMENFYFQQEHLAEMAHEEERRLAEVEYNNQVRMYRQYIAEGRATNETLEQLYYQYLINKEIADVNYEEKKKNIAIDKAQELMGVLNKIYDQEDRNLINQEGMADLQEIGRLYGEIGKQTNVKQFAELDNELRKLANNEKKRQIELLEIDRQRNREEQSRVQQEVNNGVVGANEKMVELKKDYLELTKNIISIENDLEKQVADVYRSMAEATSQYFASVRADFVASTNFASLGKMFDEVKYQVVNDLGEVEDRVGSTFQRMFDQAQTAGDKVKMAFSESMNFMTDMVNYAQQQQQVYFQQQFERLEQQKEIAIKFAGESAVAREEIERQYEEKRKQLARQQAKQEKDYAVFQAIIQTARAVVSALPNIPMSIAVGLIGAAQIAMIKSQPLPAFAEGGTHKGGFMLVNDANGSNYRETVMTPDGKIMQPKGRNVVMDAPKGTQIFTPKQWETQLTQMLFAQGISMPKVENNSITKQDLADLMNSKRPDRDYINVNIDKQGFQTMITRNGQKVIPLNNRIRIKGR